MLSFDEFKERLDKIEGVTIEIGDETLQYKLSLDDRYVISTSPRSSTFGNPSKDSIKHGIKEHWITGIENLENGIYIVNYKYMDSQSKPHRDVSHSVYITLSIVTRTPVIL